MEKDKKKTLTISSSLKKKIDTSSISSNGKKSFSIEKIINLITNHLIEVHLIKILALKENQKKETLQERLSSSKLLKIL